MPFNKKYQAEARAKQSKQREEQIKQEQSDFKNKFDTRAEMVKIPTSAKYSIKQQIRDEALKRVGKQEEKPKEPKSAKKEETPKE